MLESSHTKYFAMVQDGKLSPEEARVLMKGFPAHEVAGHADNTVRIVGTKEFNDIKESIMNSPPVNGGCVLRNRAAEIKEFRWPKTGDVARYIVDPWVR
ncbi:hypothetical protein J5277_09280 [Rhizobium sp. 16-449-1b]|uniref:hypothetical protein n=1 Tax=Rhizobium sp. 16-449-1b TaxID=2819989 RepID=UPI001ADAB253|nr:hypothetical protein [Rhizobium sp. 16-449-1b]MBO9194296.1 hypothetical protein [Rhizobium sp. 16-449-1b]